MSQSARILAVLEKTSLDRSTLLSAATKRLAQAGDTQGLSKAIRMRRNVGRYLRRAERVGDASAATDAALVRRAGANVRAVDLGRTKAILDRGLRLRVASMRKAAWDRNDVQDRAIQGGTLAGAAVGALDKKTFKPEALAGKRVAKMLGKNTFLARAASGLVGAAAVGTAAGLPRMVAPGFFRKKEQQAKLGFEKAAALLSSDDFVAAQLAGQVAAQELMTEIELSAPI